MAPYCSHILLGQGHVLSVSGSWGQTDISQNISTDMGSILEHLGDIWKECGSHRGGHPHANDRPMWTICLHLEAGGGGGVSSLCQHIRLADDVVLFSVEAASPLLAGLCTHGTPVKQRSRASVCRGRAILTDIGHPTLLKRILIHLKNAEKTNHV